MTASAAPLSAPLDAETVEARVLTAIKTLDAASDPDRRYLYGARSAWPAIQRDFADFIGNEAAARERAHLARFQPTRAEIDDMMPALSLIGPEGKDFFWLLRARAYGRSFQRIADMRGRTGEYWRRTFRRIMSKIVTRAVAVHKS